MLYYEESRACVCRLNVCALNRFSQRGTVHQRSGCTFLYYQEAPLCLCVSVISVDTFIVSGTTLNLVKACLWMQQSGGRGCSIVTMVVS